MNNHHEPATYPRENCAAACGTIARPKKGREALVQRKGLPGISARGAAYSTIAPATADS